MAVYVVTWNLNKEGAQYATARAAFLAQLGGFEHVRTGSLDTVAWVSTVLNAQQITAHLHMAQDKNDTLLVSKMNAGEYFGYLDPQIWEWIAPRL